VSLLITSAEKPAGTVRQICAPDFALPPPQTTLVPKPTIASKEDVLFVKVNPFVLD